MIGKSGLTGTGGGGSQRQPSSGGNDSVSRPRSTKKSTERGCTANAAYKGFLLKEEATEKTGSTGKTFTSPAAYGLPASAYRHVSLVPTSSSVDVKQIKEKVTIAAVNFLEPVLKLLGFEKEVLEIRFDTEVTFQNSCRMYVELPEDGELIKIYREILNMKEASYFNYEVDFKQPNPEQQVLEEIFADLLILYNMQLLISIKGDEVSRNPWGKYDGGFISIGPRNAGINGNPEQALNTVFRWKSPKDFIEKHQSGEIASTFSEIEGLKKLSELLPKIPPDILSQVNGLQDLS